MCVTVFLWDEDDDRRTTSERRSRDALACTGGPCVRGSFRAVLLWFQSASGGAGLEVWVTAFLPGGGAHTLHGWGVSGLDLAGIWVGTCFRVFEATPRERWQGRALLNCVVAFLHKPSKTTQTTSLYPIFPILLSRTQAVSRPFSPTRIVLDPLLCVLQWAYNAFGRSCPRILWSTFAIRYRIILHSTGRHCS